MNKDSNYYATLEESQSLSSFSTKTFGLMCLGVLLTFITATLVISTGLTNSYLRAISNPLLILAPFVIQLVLITVIRKTSRSLNALSATLIFFIYAVIEGIAISPMLVYYGASVAIVSFLGAAIFFGSMSIFGFVTKRDLMKLGPIFSIGIMSLLVYNLVTIGLSFAGINLINSGLDLVVSSIGLLLFIGITAFDVQKMKLIYLENSSDNRALNSASVVSALELHLDFMGIFLYLLRILGRRN